MKIVNNLIFYYCLGLVPIVSTISCNSSDTEADLLGGWQYYSNNFYWEAYFDKDSMLLFNDALNLILDTDYQFDESKKVLKILKNNTTLFTGEIDENLSDRNEIIFLNENEQVIFFRIPGDYSLNDQSSMISHMESFEDRKIKFLRERF